MASRSLCRLTTLPKNATTFPTTKQTLDDNHNGKVSKHEFLDLDENKDGRVSHHDAVQRYSQAGAQRIPNVRRQLR